MISQMKQRMSLYMTNKDEEAEALKFTRKRLVSEHVNRFVAPEDLVNVAQSILLLHSSQRNVSDIKILMRATEKIQFFEKVKNELGISGLTMCLKYLQLERHLEGQTIFSQGEKGDKFFIILSGTVGIYIKQSNPKGWLYQQKKMSIAQKFMSNFQKREPTMHSEEDDRNLVKINQLYQGQTFGELALINDAPRMATVIPLTNCTFAVLSRTDYKSILSDLHTKEMEKKIVELQSVPMLDQISRKGLQMLIYTFEQKHYKYSQIVYREGDPTNGLIYIIIDGEFKIIKNLQQSQDDKLNGLFNEHKKAQKLEICIVGKDSIFGEDEPLSDIPKREFTIQCASFTARVYAFQLENLKKRVALSSEKHLITFLKGLNEFKSRWRKMLSIKIEQIHRSFEKLAQSQELHKQIRPQTSFDQQQVNDRLYDEESTYFGNKLQNNLLNTRCVSAGPTIDRQISIHEQKKTISESTLKLYQKLVTFKRNTRPDIDNEMALQTIQSTLKQRKPIVKKPWKLNSKTASSRKKPTQSERMSPDQMKKIHEEQEHKSEQKRGKRVFPQTFANYIHMFASPRKNSCFIEDYEQVSINSNMMRQSRQRNKAKSQQTQKGLINKFKSLQIKKTSMDTSRLENERSELCIIQNKYIFFPQARYDKISSRVSENPQGSRPLKSRKKWGETKSSTIENNQLDSTLIVDSKNDVLTKIKKNQQESLNDFQDESIVYVPCGLTSLRAKKWPIKADLFVMKMNKMDNNLQLNLVKIACTKQDYYVQNVIKKSKDQNVFIKRMLNHTYKYVPKYIQQQQNNDDDFCSTFITTHREQMDA